MLKEGSHFDLPIALGLLVALDVLPGPEVAQYSTLGELALDGAISAVAGVLPAAVNAAARELGLICPAACGSEAAWAADSGGRIAVLAAPTLLALSNHFKGTQALPLFDRIDLHVEVPAVSPADLSLPPPPRARPRWRNGWLPPGRCRRRATARCRRSGGC